MMIKKERFSFQRIKVYKLVKSIIIFELIINF